MKLIVTKQMLLRDFEKMKVDLFSVKAPVVGVFQDNAQAIEKRVCTKKDHFAELRALIKEKPIKGLRHLHINFFSR